MKQFLLSSLFLIVFSLNAQQSSTPEKVDVVSVDAAALRRIAKDSPKKNTLFYTFGIWCEPCRLHLPTAIKLAKDYDLDFYVIIVDAQTSSKTPNAADYLKKQDKDIKIAVLSDAAYGEKTQKRNTKFVTEITPSQFENIDDFSKYILLNKKGEVIMVTNYKDNKGNDWRDDSKMVQKRIVPLLEKRI